MKSLSRDELIEEVQYGRMSPAEAEAEAAKLSLGPLAATPDPRQFNPMDEVGWTLPMTVAWIAWRDPQKVLQFYDPYRAQCFDWHFRKWQIGFAGPIYEGYFLNERRSATLSLLSLSEHIDIATNTKAKKSKVREAKALLWAALQDGRLEATGLPSLNMPRVAIPAHEWHDLKAIQERGRDILRHGMNSLTGYDKILISRRSVLALWLETQPANETPALRTGAPGRPTPIHLIVAEHRRRLDSGKAEISVTAEAKHLAGWLKLTHPNVPPLTPKTIQNKIGAGHRAAKNAQN